jgi:23S rRNA (guanosine2251-2'-O)-methyltransferase
MAGRSESLNASVAAAIALYELSGVRERRGLA